MSLQEQISAVPVSYAQGSRDRPLVRFWAANPDGGLNMIQGTLVVGQMSVGHNGAYTVSGQILPPVSQVTTPKIQAPGDEPQPVDEILDGLIHAEADYAEGFQPLGVIDPDRIDIETNVDYQRTWGGQVVKTRQEITVEFTTIEIGPAFEKLLHP